MTSETVLALSGGVGGAKLALGLMHIMPPERLIVVANTGDDFEHLGLHVSPDIDTLVYTLGNLNNEELGWGRRGETWTFMAALTALGGPSWFRLGDGDLAMHVERTRRLQAGESLAAITADVSRRLGIGATLLPMSNDSVRTRLHTDVGLLDFQDYFVGRQCAPKVSSVVFDGAERAAPHPQLMAALADPGLRAVVICPSNPFVSIEPILALPGLRDAIRRCSAPVVAVSPIIAGRAVKGPTAKMMAELGQDPSAATASRRYAGLLDAVIVDELDAASTAEQHGALVFAAATLMQDLHDRKRVAARVLEVADQLRIQWDRAPA